MNGFEVNGAKNRTTSSTAAAPVQPSGERQSSMKVAAAGGKPPIWATMSR